MAMTDVLATLDRDNSDLRSAASDASAPESLDGRRDPHVQELTGANSQRRVKGSPVAANERQPHAADVARPGETNPRKSDDLDSRAGARKTADTHVAKSAALKPPTGRSGARQTDAKSTGGLEKRSRRHKVRRPSRKVVSVRPPIGKDDHSRPKVLHPCRLCPVGWTLGAGIRWWTSRWWVDGSMFAVVCLLCMWDRRHCRSRCAAFVKFDRPLPPILYESTRSMICCAVVRPFLVRWRRRRRRLNTSSQMMGDAGIRMPGHLNGLSRMLGHRNGSSRMCWLRPFPDTMRPHRRVLAERFLPSRRRRRLAGAIEAGVEVRDVELSRALVRPAKMKAAGAGVAAPAPAPARARARVPVAARPTTTTLAAAKRVEAAPAAEAVSAIEAAIRRPPTFVRPTSRQHPPHPHLRHPHRSPLLLSQRCSGPN